MKCSEEKTVVPAAQGFYVVTPIHDGPSDAAVVDIWYDPVVAWSIDPDGVVQPIVYGGSLIASDGNCDVLCPNGRVVSPDCSWESLGEWLSGQKMAAARRKAEKAR